MSKPAMRPIFPQKRELTTALHGLPRIHIIGGGHIPISIGHFGASAKETIAAFVTAFRWLGYIPCSNSNIEFGFEKVALYADHSSPKHMARQLPNGKWTSKCGGAEDITHYTLDALDSYGPHPLKAHYGCVVLYMKRPIPLSWIVRLAQWFEWKVESSLWERLGSIVWKRPQKAVPRVPASPSC
jgi:hypothetical protein